MGSDQHHSMPPTADTAGSTGLWRLSQKMTTMALSWKLLQDLEEQKIGVNEVEAEAWKRQANREVKKGKEWPKGRRGRYEGDLRRDEKYIEKQMRIRAQQAKEDWQEARAKYTSRKKSMLKKAETERDRNAIRRDMRKFQKRKVRRRKEGTHSEDPGDRRQGKEEIWREPGN